MKKEAYPITYKWLTAQVVQIVENLKAFSALDCSKIIEEITRVRVAHQKKIEELTERFEDEVSYLTLSFEFDYEDEKVEFDFGEWSPLEEIEFDEDTSEITDLLEEMFKKSLRQKLIFERHLPR